MTTGTACGNRCTAPKATKVPAGQVAGAVSVDHARRLVASCLLPDPDPVHVVGVATDGEPRGGVPADLALPPLHRGVPAVSATVHPLPRVRHDRDGRHTG